MEITKLLKQSKTGNQHALLELIERLSPIRQSLCTRFSSLSREDLDQDLILVLIDCVHTYQEEKCSFQWYVREKSRYYTLDKAKQWKKELEKTTPADEEQLITLTDGITTEEKYENKQLTQQMKNALSKLDPREKFVIYFYYYREYSLKEIAKKMNLSISTVSKLKTKALKNLKKAL